MDDKKIEKLKELRPYIFNIMSPILKFIEVILENKWSRRDIFKEDNKTLKIINFSKYTILYGYPKIILIEFLIDDTKAPAFEETMLECWDLLLELIGENIKQIREHYNLGFEETMGQLLMDPICLSLEKTKRII